MPASALRDLSLWIEEEARMMGVCIAAEAARVCEIHIFRDVATPRSFLGYEPVSRPLQTANNRIWVDRPLYLKRGNNTYCLVIYSKMYGSKPQKEERGRERVREQRYRMLPEMGVADIIRFEWRAAGAKAVRDTFGSDSLEHMIGFYDGLDDLLDQKIGELFRIKAPTISPVQLWAFPVQNVQVTTLGKWESILSADDPRAALVAFALDTARTELAQESWQLPKGRKGVSNVGVNALLKAAGKSHAQIKGLQETANRGRQTRLCEGGVTCLELYAELHAAAMARPTTLLQSAGVPLPVVAFEQTTETEEAEQMVA